MAHPRGIRGSGPSHRDTMLLAGPEGSEPSAVRKSGEIPCRCTLRVGVLTNAPS